MRASLGNALCALIFSACGTLCLPASADTLVLVAEADRDSPVTASIVTGIREGDGRVDVQPVSPSNLSRTITSLDRRYEAIIVLGRALIAERFLSRDDVPVLYGAFYGALPEGSDKKGISLNVDPDYVLGQVAKTGLPIDRVWTVVSPSRASMPDAVKLAAANRIKAELSVVEGEQATARAWFDVLQTVDSTRDAIYIVDDTHLDTSGTYRFLIEKAWKNDVLVISTVPSHASRGVSLGFIPDLVAYGRLLHRSVRQLASDRSFEPEFLLNGETVQRVFNKRTLGHISRHLPADLDKFRRDDIVIE